MDEILQLANSVMFIEKGQCLVHGTLPDVLGHHTLQNFYGLEETGSLIEAIIENHDNHYGLTVLKHPAGDIHVPHVSLPVGQSVRLRILPRDVALAHTAPKDSSVLNILRGNIQTLHHDSSAHVDVLLDIGSPLWARITRKSCERLTLREGSPVYALIKSVALIHW